MAKQLLSAQLIGQLNVPKLARAMDKKERVVLFKTAAYARLKMKGGMRRTKEAGPIGGFPASRKGPLKRMIAFAVDTRSATAVVGPAAFNKQPDWLPGGIRTVPQLLNEGGTVRRTIKWTKSAAVGGASATRKITVIYKPRPFVTLTNVPAAKKFAENMENIPLGV